MNHSVASLPGWLGVIGRRARGSSSPVRLSGESRPCEGQVGRLALRAARRDNCSDASPDAPMHRSPSPLLVLLAFASVTACTQSPSPTTSSTAQARDVAAAPVQAADPAGVQPPAAVPAMAPAPAALEALEAEVAAPAAVATPTIPGKRVASPAVLP